MFLGFLSFDFGGGAMCWTVSDYKGASCTSGFTFKVGAVKLMPEMQLLRPEFEFFGLLMGKCLSSKF